MMMRSGAVAALLASAARSAHGAVAADEVTALPGWDGALPSRQFSGFLPVGDGKHFHYWLVESERAPTLDPLVLWVQGGPGGSSLEGMFTENLGP